MIGQAIGSDRFVKLAIIGSGGFATVYRGFDRFKHQAVTIKEMPSSNYLNQFMREQDFLRKLDSPYIAKGIMALVEGETLYLINEFIDGVTLEDLITEGKVIDIEDIVSYGIQIARALCDIHAYDILHNDIKPSNIIKVHDEQVVTRNSKVEIDNIKVLDFGISRLLKQSVFIETDTIEATLEYAAPELLRNEDALGFALDSWSTGLLLFELITLKHPFRYSHPGHTAAKIANYVPHLPLDLRNHRVDTPHALATLIMDLLDRRPNKRPTASETQARLEAIQDSQPQKQTRIVTRSKLSSLQV